MNIAKLRGCPINCKNPTTLGRTTFERMCLVFQKKAESKGGSTMTQDGFTTNNKHVCPSCKIGKAVKKGKAYEPPFNITIAEITLP